MTAIGLIRSRGLCGRGWSVAALMLCLAAVAATFAVVSAGQGVTDFRWWLLAFPAGACTVAVLLPVRNVLIAAAIVMSMWCAVGAASVGIFFAPSFVALILAIRRSW